MKHNGKLELLGELLNDEDYYLKRSELCKKRAKLKTPDQEITNFIKEVEALCQSAAK